MKLVCAPKSFKFKNYASDLDVVLYSRPQDKTVGFAGHNIVRDIQKLKLNPSLRAWDFLSIALSCVCADMAGHRKKSSDGWTREFDLTIAVNDPDFWDTQIDILQTAINFLTTDRWNIKFVGGGFSPSPIAFENKISGDSVTLFSGGMDSLIGTIDLVSNKRNPVTVSQTVLGDKDKQVKFPKLISKGLESLVMNHTAEVPNGEKPASQRSRSIIFLAYASLVAGSVESAPAKPIDFFVSENGFISLNPPLTPMRVGSLSTRTTHPTYLSRIQSIFDSANLGLTIINNYSFNTKGEMLVECADQNLIKNLAHKSTSCGRYLIFGHTHCGRCVPCLVRRAAFYRWGIVDKTTYVFADIGKKGSDYSGFDDVRAVAMATIDVKNIGIERWMGANLTSSGIVDKQPYLDLAERGLNELEVFLKSRDVK